jgi:APA family basic amino acid/polyamine antiporter
VLGGYAVLSADNLLQITLASNTGTFLVYGMTCALVLVAFGHQHKRNFIRHVVVPVLGLLANVGMLIGIVYMSVSSGGATQTDTLIALGIVGAWIIVGAVWLVLNSAGSNKSLLVRPPLISPER